jgi:hypothetical protein
MRKLAIAYFSILFLTLQKSTNAFIKSFSLDVSNACQSAIDSSLEKLKSTRA